MKVKVLSVFMSILFLGLMLCACGSADAKAAYKPPARVFDVEIEGTSEPKIDGVEITYDSKARIDTVSYAVDGYDYKQEYSYDTDQIVIKTIYKTEVIEEKVIKYVEIPVTSGFAEVDGYIVRVTEDMPVDMPINDNNDDIPTESATQAENVYTNEKYGWSVTLPDVWMKYGIVTEHDEDQPERGRYGLVDFSYNETDEFGNYLLCFWIYAVEAGSEYDKSDDLDKGALLGRNSEYAFYYSGATGGVMLTPDDPEYERKSSEYSSLYEAQSKIFESFSLV